MASILVVDDEPEVRNLLKAMLERENYEVTTASNGQEAINLFRQKVRDLVITDIIMPVKEGIETIHDLTKSFPGVKIIAISGGSRLEPNTYLDTAEAFGALKTLEKPFHRQELLDAVKEILGSTKEQ